MTEQLPSVSRADTDGNGRVKLARRPALSCAECRMRKVKCDRNKPCGACIRIKSEKCTYRRARPGIRTSPEKSPEVTSTSLSSSNDRSSVQPSPQPLRGSNALDLMVDRSTHTETGASSLVAVLLRENERLRTAVTRDAAPDGDTRPISDIITDIPGTFQKSKFFGQSHWMNALEPVSSDFALSDGHVRTIH